MFYACSAFAARGFSTHTYTRYNVISFVKFSDVVCIVQTPVAASNFGLKHLPPPAEYGYVTQSSSPAKCVYFGCLCRRLLLLFRMSCRGRHTITMMPGDGIGPEMCGYVREAFRTCGAPIDFELVELDPLTPDREGWEAALISILRNGVAIKGNIETRFHDPSVRSRNAELRTRLGLFANIVRIQSLPNVKARHKVSSVELKHCSLYIDNLYAHNSTAVCVFKFHCRIWIL